MKALELLYQYQQADRIVGGYMNKSIYEAIIELEAHIADYRTIKRRLDNRIKTLLDLQDENKALVKILTKMNEEVLDIKD